MTNDHIELTKAYLEEIVPRSNKLVIRDEFIEDECRWFLEAIKNKIISVRECSQNCPRFKKWKERGPDEFIVNEGKGGIRHLFSLSNKYPIEFNREYLPHIAAYARLIFELNYMQKYSSFSLYRKFTKDLLYKKKGGSFETDAEFYDKKGNLYLHVEVKKTEKQTLRLVEGLNRTSSFDGLNRTHAKELEYVLDLKPKYLWVVGPGSIDPERFVYGVEVQGLNALFKPMKKLPSPPC